MTDSPRRKVAFSVEIEDLGKRNIEIIDRLSPDDIFTHMAQMEVFRVLTGYDDGDEVNENFIDFVVSDNLVVR